MGFDEAREAAVNFKASINPARSRTFKEVFDEWYETKVDKTSSETERKHKLRAIEMYALPFIGDMPIDSIELSHIYSIIERLNKLNKVPTAKKVKQYCASIFQLARLKGYCNNNPALDTRGMFGAHVEQHHPALVKREDIGELMRRVESYEHVQVRLMMLFNIYTFCRPGEVRYAEWGEIDFTNKTWTISAEKMKMRRVHKNSRR